MMDLVVVEKWGFLMADGRAYALVAESERGAVERSDGAMVDRLVVPTAEMMADQTVALWAVAMGKSMVGS
jgi:hypothetical protein